jgi:hypothetical protein
MFAAAAKDPHAAPPVVTTLFPLIISRSPDDLPSIV